MPIILQNSYFSELEKYPSNCYLLSEDLAKLINQCNNVIIVCNYALADI